MSSLFSGGGQTSAEKALTKAQTQAVQFGTQQAETSLPAATSGLTSALSFFQTLLSGNQNQVAAAISPDVQNIETQYGTAQRTADEFSPRGGGATAANEESRFTEANTIANLFTQARLTGAQEVSSIASALGSLGVGELGGAESTAANTVGELQTSQQNQQAQQGQAGSAIGSLIALLATA